MAISRTDAIYLLRRSGFHARPAEVTQLMGAASWEAAVDRVLDVSANPPAPRPSSITSPNLQNWQHRVELVKWWVERMRTTPTPIVEKMALFFHGFHFTSSWDKKNDPILAFNQIDLFRRHALGDYHQLAQAVSIDPWMLHYLDNGANKAPKNINENFGRELLELFLFGRDGYAESEVREMSRAWSGHILDSAGTGYLYDASVHDNGPKTIYGVTKNWNGPEALTEALRGSQAVRASRYFAGKLWQFFAGTVASGAVLDALAAEFRANDLSLKALVRAIFLRPEFRSVAVRQGRVVTPVEWFVSLTGALGVPAGESEPQWWLPSMQQDPFRPPNVSGWRHNGYWLTGSSWWKRGECARWLSYIAIANDRPYRVMPHLNQHSTGTQVADSAAALLGVELTPATRKVVTDWAGSLSGTWYGGSTRPFSIVLVSLSPEFNVG
jgi:uncharacterized protein (DUF1800 family)